MCLTTLQDCLGKNKHCLSSDKFRAQTTSRLIYWSINRKLVNSTVAPASRSVFLSHYVDYVIMFWTVGRTKTEIWNCDLWVKEIETATFTIFRHPIDLIIYQIIQKNLMKRIISCSPTKFVGLQLMIDKWMNWIRRKQGLEAPTTLCHPLLWMHS